MKNIWSVLCQSSIIDKDTNLISLHNCLEQININVEKNQAPPEEKVILPIEFDIVSLWVDDETKKEREFFVDINLYDPDDNKIAAIFSGKYTMEKNTKRLRSRVQSKGLPITKEGRYLFKIKMKEGEDKKFKEIVELPLDIAMSYKLLDLKK